MGTSGLFVVKKGKEIKLAQQLNSDAYPTHTLYTFGVLYNQNGTEKLIQGLENVELISYNQRENLISEYREPEGGMNFKNYMKLKEENPTISQTDFEAIYNQILNSDETIYSVNAFDFAKDVIGCEWTYIIDLNSNELSVYDSGEYVVTFALNNLPDKNECELIENGEYVSTSDEVESENNESVEAKDIFTLSKMSVNELKEKARELRIPRRSQLLKAELIEKISQHYIKQERTKKQSSDDMSIGYFIKHLLD